MYRADLILGLLIGAGFAYLLVEVQDMRWQAALAPGLAAGAGLALAIHHLLTTALRLLRNHTQRQAPKPIDLPLPYHWGDILPIAGFLLAVGLVLVLGFGVGGTLFVLLWVFFTGGRNMVIAGLMALPVYPFFAIVIERGLGLMMFRGLLPGWLGL